MRTTLADLLNNHSITVNREGNGWVISIYFDDHKGQFLDICNYPRRSDSVYVKGLYLRLYSVIPDLPAELDMNELHELLEYLPLLEEGKDPISRVIQLAESIEGLDHMIIDDSSISITGKNDLLYCSILRGRTVLHDWPVPENIYNIMPEIADIIWGEGDKKYVRMHERLDPCETSAFISSRYHEQQRAEADIGDIVLPGRFTIPMPSHIIYARDNKTVLGYKDRTLALKITKYGSDEQMDRAVKELNLMEMLSSCTDNVLHVYDSLLDEETKNVYIQMEEAITLKAALSCGALRFKDIPVIGAGICDALIMARDKLGIYHNDISLSNCYYKDGVAKLGDFDSAIPVYVSRPRDEMTGTVKYMAPESYNDRIHDERSETYSFWMMVYVMCNRGFAAFEPEYGFDEATAMRMKGDKELPMPADLEIVHLDFAKEIWKCIKKGCAFDPAERYQTFEEMRAALDKMRKMFQAMEIAVNTMNDFHLVSSNTNEPGTPTERAPVWIDTEELSPAAKAGLGATALRNEKEYHLKEDFPPYETIELLDRIYRDNNMDLSPLIEFYGKEDNDLTKRLEVINRSRILSCEEEDKAFLADGILPGSLSRLVVKIASEYDVFFINNVDFKKEIFQIIRTGEILRDEYRFVNLCSFNELYQAGRDGLFMAEDIYEQNTQYHIRSLAAWWIHKKIVERILLSFEYLNGTRQWPVIIYDKINEMYEELKQKLGYRPDSNKEFMAIAGEEFEKARDDLNREQRYEQEKELQLKYLNRLHLDEKYPSEEALQAVREMYEHQLLDPDTLKIRVNEASEVADYLDRISLIPPLSLEEEMQLFEQYKNGDQTAKENIIKANLMLCASIVKRYIRYEHFIDPEIYMSLILEGKEGLEQAVDAYVEKEGTDFKTFAAWYIHRRVNAGFAIGISCKTYM